MTEEWIVIRLDRTIKGGFERAREGNRAKFNLEEARKILTRLTDEALPKRNVWRLVHYKTLTEPTDHHLWVQGLEARHGAGAADKILEHTPER